MCSFSPTQTLRKSSQDLPHEKERTAELAQGQVVVDAVLVEHSDAAQTLEPGPESLAEPTSLVAAQLTAVLRGAAIGPTGSNQVDAFLRLALVQGVAALSLVADEALGLAASSPLGQHRLDQSHLVKRGAVYAQSDGQAPTSAQRP